MCTVAVADDDSDDMFKPPKMDDDDFSPFGGKGGLFSGGKGLFDDDDEVHFSRNFQFSLCFRPVPHESSGGPLPECSYCCAAFYRSG